jgi:hypothetical protein
VRQLQPETAGMSGGFLLQASINPAAHTDNHSFIYGAHDKQKKAPLDMTSGAF